MRFVIDTKEIKYKVKDFWNYKILRKPRPVPKIEDLIESVVMLGVASAVMGTVHKVLKEDKDNNNKK